MTMKRGKRRKKIAEIESLKISAEKVPTQISAEKVPPKLIKYWTAGIVAAILLLTALIYSNALNNGFIYFDDPELVMENYSIRHISLDNFIYYFTTPIQFTYLPLGLISYAIDYQIGELNPFIYHLHSLIIHLLNVILVYWLFQAMTKKPAISIFIALLFAVHPVNVDAVAAVSTRIYPLTTFFYLGALLSYTYYLKKNFQMRYLVFALFFFILSVLTKSASVVLPIVLLLWDYYFDRKWDIKLFVEKIPFVLISIIFGILTLNIRGDIVPPVQYNLFDRLILYCSSLTDYFVRLLFPFQLSMSYAYPVKDGMLLPLALYLSPFILGLIVWGLYKLKISKKTLVIGLLFFLINITLSQSVLLIDNFMSNRYAYLSYIGLFFILADVNHEILGASAGWKYKLRPVWLMILTVFVVGFSALTYNRNFVWKDTITLFDDVIQKQPKLPWVYSNRGIAKYKANDFEGALKDFNKSLELDPDFVLSLYYRSVLNSLSSNYVAALADLDRVIATAPNYANAYNTRGMVKRDLKDYEGAMADLSKAIELNDSYVEAYLNRGILKQDLADYQGAIADYSTAISYHPEFTVAYYDRGLAKTELADYQGALDDFSKAIELTPDYGDAFNMRSVIKFKLKDQPGSCDDQKKALSLGRQLPPGQVSANCP